LLPGEYRAIGELETADDRVGVGMVGIEAFDMDGVAVVADGDQQGADAQADVVRAETWAEHQGIADIDAAIALLEEIADSVNAAARIDPINIVAVAAV